MSWLPRSLYGRTLLVLATGLVLAEVANQAVNVFDRGSAVYRLGAQVTARRIAQSARILNRLPPAERTRVVEEMSGPSFTAVLSDAPLKLGAGLAEHDRYEKSLAESIAAGLPEGWRTSVDIIRLGGEHRPRSYRPVEATPLEQWIARHFYYLLPGKYSVVAQIGLEDGTTAAFYARIPHEPLSRFESLVPRLLLSLAIFVVLGAAAIGAITRSLEKLSRAAGQVGSDPDGPPVPEEGPSEVRSVIRAFNDMRLQIRRHLHERSQMLGAISHDLRTPVTRMRLRAEMIDDPAMRARFVRDLEEMDQLAGSTLEFMKSLGEEPLRQAVDVRALVESLCEDWAEAGREVVAHGHPRAPLPAHPQALRRCLENLVDNALRYGQRARIDIEDDGDLLRLRVSDDGPGIPEADLERVFEPWFRVESSRNRETGGTGLGLAIARNIARWHGGDIVLRNGAGGGLVAELCLPRVPRAGLANARPAAE